MPSSQRQAQENQRLGSRSSRRVRLRDVDGGGAGGVGAERGERADWPRARHQHTVARPHPGSFDTVGSDGGRLDQRPLSIGDRLGKADDLILRDYRELCHPAPGMGEPDARHRCAQVLEPAPAVRAVPAVHKRHDRDPIALGNARHARTGCHDVAGELVAEDLRVLRPGQRMGLDRRDDRPRNVLVQVGAADSAGCDPYNDFAGVGRGRLGHLLDAEVARGMEAKRAHVPTTPRGPRR